jgi:hypothetical protein
MKRKKNGLLIGTIIVVLVAVMVFLQSQNIGASSDADHEHSDEPAATKPAGGAPTIEELQNQVQGSTGDAPRTIRPGQSPAGPIGPNPNDTMPQNHWYDKKSGTQ